MPILPLKDLLLNNLLSNEAPPNNVLPKAMVSNNMQRIGSHLSAISSVAMLLLMLILAGCGSPDAGDEQGGEVVRPELTSYADTVAWRMVETMGGLEAWRELPFLGFEFAVHNGSARVPVASHLWNRRTGEYRLEWSPGSDSTYQALFNVRTREGDVFLNGQPVDTSQQNILLKHAYTRFINDTYWMLAPVKVFDPGVTRTHLPDSSTADMDVIRLTFGDVGLTPNDRYYLYIDKETNRLQEWAFVLQGNPAAAPRHFRWMEAEVFPTSAGSLEVFTRKESMSSPRAILTDRVAMPDSLPSGILSDPAVPMVQ